MAMGTSALVMRSSAARLFAIGTLRRHIAESLSRVRDQRTTRRERQCCIAGDVDRTPWSVPAMML
jgi:hypothetical protein